MSATDLILRLIEHEVPRYGLVHLLDLPEERLEIIELVVVRRRARPPGQRVASMALPEGALVISVLRDGSGFVPKADTVVEAGDEVLVVLDPGLEEDITAQFVGDGTGGGRPPGDRRRRSGCAGADCARWLREEGVGRRSSSAGARRPRRLRRVAAAAATAPSRAALDVAAAP